MKKKKITKYIVKGVDEKYRLTFLENSMFQGTFREKGTSITVPKHTKEAYQGRTTLRFEKI